MTDAPALARVYLEAESAVRVALGLVPVQSESLAAWFEPRTDSIVLATSAGDVDGSCDPIGFVEVADDELRALYVLPSHWGRGVADALHARGLALGARRLISIAANMRARRFYERSGWVFDADDPPRDFGGAMVPFVRYRRA